MSNEIITLGENINPPDVDSEISQALYNLVRDDEFTIGTFNAILFTIVVYLDKHKVKYGDKALPWAESLTET